MRAFLLLAAALVAAGCFYPGPEETGRSESTPTGDEGVGSSGVDGTGSGGESAVCPPETQAQIVAPNATGSTCPDGG